MPSAKSEGSRAWPRSRAHWLAVVLAVTGGGVGALLVSRSDTQMRPSFFCNGVAQASPNCGPPIPVLRGFHRIDRSFGAIAYDQERGAWFGSYQYPSKREAQEGVIANCRQNGGADCRLMLSYTNQCAAVARAVDGGRAIVGHDSVNDRQHAVANVRRSCEGDWNTKSCSIELVNCSHHGVVRWSEWVYDDE